MKNTLNIDIPTAPRNILIIDKRLNNIWSRIIGARYTLDLFIKKPNVMPNIIDETIWIETGITLDDFEFLFLSQFLNKK